MGKTEWSRYFRLSLLLHLVILSLGGALLYAQRSLPEKSLGPIRIHLAEPDPGKKRDRWRKGRQYRAVFEWSQWRRPSGSSRESGRNTE